MNQKKRITAFVNDVFDTLTGLSIIITRMNGEEVSCEYFKTVKNADMEIVLKLKDAQKEETTDKAPESAKTAADDEATEAADAAEAEDDGEDQTTEGSETSEPQAYQKEYDYGMGTKFNMLIFDGNIDLLKKNGIEPSALEYELVHVDFDVTPMDNSKSHKEGVSRTYKGFDGYAPMIRYIGTEGYMLNIERRKGSQHCQSGTQEFREECIPAAKKLTKKTLLFRFDPGNDSTDNIGYL